MMQLCSNVIGMRQCTKTSLVATKVELQFVARYIQETRRSEVVEEVIKCIYLY